uniref:Uncharacterized protein n=1 Tax=Timema shepardi TaxID=629360 RepID=A0A7R9AM39_TIMSH|nr:unnamed protein product [Timema shepardi]
MAYPTLPGESNMFCCLCPSHVGERTASHAAAEMTTRPCGAVIETGHTLRRVESRCCAVMVVTLLVSESSHRVDSGNLFWKIQLDQDLLDTLVAIYPEWFKDYNLTRSPAMAEGGSGGSASSTPDTGPSSPRSHSTQGLLPLSPPKVEVDDSPLQKSMDKNKECRIPSARLASATSDWTGFHSLFCGQFLRGDGDCDWRAECASSVSIFRLRTTEQACVLCVGGRGGGDNIASFRVWYTILATNSAGDSEVIFTDVGKGGAVGKGVKNKIGSSVFMRRAGKARAQLLIQFRCPCRQSAVISPGSQRRHQCTSRQCPHGGSRRNLRYISRNIVPEVMPGRVGRSSPSHSRSVLHGQSKSTLPHDNNCDGSFLGELNTSTRFLSWLARGLRNHQ